MRIIRRSAISVSMFDSWLVRGDICILTYMEPLGEKDGDSVYCAYDL
jgi:hypothetical protein